MNIVFRCLFKAGIHFFIWAVYWFSSNKRIAVFTRKIWCGNPIKVAQVIVTNIHLYLRIDISFRRVSAREKRIQKKARAKYSVLPVCPISWMTSFSFAAKICSALFSFPPSSFCQAFIAKCHSFISGVWFSALYVREPAIRRDIFSSKRKGKREEKLQLFQRWIFFLD